MQWSCRVFAVGVYWLWEHACRCCTVTYISLLSALSLPGYSLWTSAPFLQKDPSWWLKEMAHYNVKHYSACGTKPEPLKMYKYRFIHAVHRHLTKHGYITIMKLPWAWQLGRRQIALRHARFRSVPGCVWPVDLQTFVLRSLNTTLTSCQVQFVSFLLCSTRTIHISQNSSTWMGVLRGTVQKNWNCFCQKMNTNVQDSEARKLFSCWRNYDCTVSRLLKPQSFEAGDAGRGIWWPRKSFVLARRETDEK